ncbi:MAG: flippase-like domain-containing protein [Kiritimatiellae bacterium]|nr:flippase-like domain-containing protein [Kiritimatiellia bacterium]
MKSRTLFIKIAISLGMLAVLFIRVPWAELGDSVRSMRAGYVAVTVALSFVLVASSCAKWWMILRMTGHRVPFLTLYRWYFVGYFYSNFLPSNVGGDVARVWLAGRRIGSQRDSLVAVFAERFTGMLFLLLMVILSPMLNRGLWRHPALWIPALAAVAILLGMLIAVLGFRWIQRSGRGARLMSGFRRIARLDRDSRWTRGFDRIAAKLESFAGRAGLFFTLLRKRPSAFWSVTGITALFYLLTVLNISVTCRAFGVWPDLRDVATVLPAALFVASMPIALGSLGLAEGAYVYYFGLVGLPGGLILAMGILLRLKIFMLSLVGLVVQMREPIHPIPASHGGSDDEPSI